MNKNLLKVSTLCAAGTVLLIASQIKPIAASFAKEEPVAGISLSLDSFYNHSTLGNISVLAQNRAMILDNVSLASTEENFVNISDTERVEDVVRPEDEPVVESPEETSEEDMIEAIKSKYENIGIATVDNYLNIREKAGEDSKIIGKLPKDAGATIYGIDEDGWAKIKSGKVTGYVMSTYLTTGEEAEELAKKVGVKTATVTGETVKLREKATTESACITLIALGEELEVLKVEDEWVRVVVDNDKGWISRELVEISYELKKAVSNAELETGTSSGVSSTRANIVAYAKQFLGNRYVWGGTSLTNGADCSGFVMSVYKHFGYSLNRTSGAQSSNGTSISPSNVKAGDLLFYSNGGRINHVAMYIGNNQVIHASNPRSGIKISNANYRKPVKAARIIND